MRLFYACFFVLFTQLTFGQIAQLARQEVEVKDGGVGHTAVIGDKGFILFGASSDRRNPEYEIRFFNKELQEQDHVVFPVIKGYRAEDYIISEDNSFGYFLFKNRKGLFRINRVRMEDGNVSYVDGAFPKKFNVGEIELLGEGLFVRGFLKGKNVLMHVNLRNGKSQLITLPNLGKYLSIKDVEANIEQGLITVTVLYSPSRSRVNEARMAISFFNEEGQKDGNHVSVDGRGANNPIDARVFWADEDAFYVAGTYSSDKAMLGNGLYLAYYKNGRQQFIKFHNFADMDRYHDFLSAKKKRSAEKKKEKKKAKGKENVISSMVYLNDLRKFNDQYVLVGEVYFPTYRTETRTTYVNGQAQTQVVTVFDGFQYTHAVVLGLDDEGEKLWDHCFRMSLDHKPFRVRSYVRATSNEHEMHLFYPAGSFLHTLMIDKGGNYTEKNMGRLQTDDPSEKIRWNGILSSEHWYDNYFVVYGHQRIKGEDGKRTVYFVSKISVDPTGGEQLQSARMY